MPLLPHDAADLLLAPVILELDARIAELSDLGQDELPLRVGLVSDGPDSTRTLREVGLLTAVSHLINCHEWKLSWDPRGIKVSHGAHQVVLGVPSNFLEYLEGTP